MADDRTPPGIGGQESQAQETLTPEFVNGLKDRYLKARGLEGANSLHLGYPDGSFMDFSTTPEADAWTLVVRTGGNEFSRFDLGIIPIRGGAFAKTIQPTTEPTEGTIAAFAFKGFLDQNFPQPEPSGSGKVPSADTQTYGRSAEIVLADSDRSQLTHLSSGRSAIIDRGTRSRGVGGEDQRPDTDSNRGTLYSLDTPEDRSQ